MADIDINVSLSPALTVEVESLPSIDVPVSFSPPIELSVEVQAIGPQGVPGVVQSITAGNNIDVDSSDPSSPIVSLEALTADDLPAGIDATNIAGGTISNIEFEYLNNLSANIQDQLNDKVEENSAITGATKTKITYDAKGLVTAGADATTSDIGEGSNLYFTDERAQDAVGGILATSSEIALSYADGTPSITGSLVAGSIDESKLDTSVNASLDLAESAVQDLSDLGITASASELNALDGITASVTELNYTDGVTSAIQTQIDGKQPLDSDLTTIAGLTPTTNNFMVATSSAWASRTPSQAKTALSLVKGDVGLGNVDNTSDANKPVSTATQTALNLKAPLASPSFTGTVTLPTGLTGVLRADSGVVSTDSDITDLVSAASDTAAGKVELATTAETTTGTDATRAVTPDGLHDMTSLAGAAWFLDEDDMASNSATKVPSQQSVKQYVTDSLVAAGAGDVVGPGSAADNTIARFDSTTGKLIQDSVVTVADTTGNISGSQRISVSDSFAISGAQALSRSGTVVQHGVHPDYTGHSFLAGGSEVAAIDSSGNLSLSGTTIKSLTLPSSNFVGTSDTQTLTGKTIDGDDNTLQDIPSTALKQNFFKGRYQANTTNSDQSGITPQFGWGFILGDNTNIIEETLTFPTAFSTILSVHVSLLGVKSGSDPANIGELTIELDASGFMIAGSDITTSGCLVTMSRTASTFGSTARWGYSWVAYGIV